MLLKAIRPSYMSILTENAKNKQYLRVHWQKKLAKQAWKIAQTDGVCPSARFYDYARAARGQAWNSLTDYIFRSGPRKQPYACLITRQKGWRVDIFCRHFQQRLQYKVNGEQNQNILKVTFRVMVSLNVNNAMSKMMRVCNSMWTGPECRNMLCELKYIERKNTGKGFCLSRGLREK